MFSSQTTLNGFDDKDIPVLSPEKRQISFRLMAFNRSLTIDLKMSSDNIQRQIEFILEHQAKFSEDLERLKEVQSQQAESINKLTEATGTLTEATGTLTEATASTQAQLDSVITEMRDGFNKLILSNEVTRDFANKIASLEVQTS